MRLLRLLPLALLAASAVGATCVTETEQRGPAGPWVGEVRNYDAEPAAEVLVRADLYDAHGVALGQYGAGVCPSYLHPGEAGAFEIFYPGGAALPIEARRFVAEPGYLPVEAPHREGLSVTTLATNRTERFVLLELRNESQRTFHSLRVCGTLRDHAGKLLEVGSARPFPSVLRPGETNAFPLYFNSMPSGTFEYFAEGFTYCCVAPLVFSESAFQVTAAKITRSTAGTEIVVLGEFQNTSGQDLGNPMMQAWLKDSPQRVRREISLSCGGILPIGEKAPGWFVLSTDDTTIKVGDVVVSGIEAHSRGNSSIRLQASQIRTRDAATSGDLPAMAVEGVLTNVASVIVEFFGGCINLRDRDGRLTGSGYLDAHGYLAPGESLRFSGSAFVLDEWETVEVLSYGEERLNMPQPIPVLAP